MYNIYIYDHHMMFNAYAIICYKFHTQHDQRISIKLPWFNEYFENEY